MRQRGVALITAIVLVAIATVLAVHVGTRAALDLRRTAGLFALDQGWQVALGAEAWAAEVLLDDYEDDQEIDHPGERWAQPLPALPVDGGELRGAVEDMQGRFNLNSLIDGQGQAVDEAIERFQWLLVQVGANPRWATILVDWLDEGTVPQFPEGAEDGIYLSQNPPYRAANGPITTVSELLALPGMTQEEYQRIRPYVAALPVSVKEINVCSASGPVLEALTQEGTGFGDPESLALNRRNGCFPTPEDVQARVGRPLEYISRSSNWFRAVTAVRIGTSEITLYSLIERNNGRSRVVLRSTGTE
ncbi:MAG: type II secretion system minor pseudopilin GspK [Steroidobacteraceae bacterium]